MLFLIETVFDAKAQVFEGASDAFVPATLLDWGINPYQTMVDIILLLFTIYVIMQKPERPEKPFSKEEIDQLCEEWEPEPLFPELTPQMQLDMKAPIITNSTITHVGIDGKQVLNLARFNFLGFVSNPKIEEASTKTLYEYGVGTCGPRQFYGTIDVHLNLEKRINEFMKTPACLIYSYGIATSSSSIPAFAGRGDILIVDKGISIGMQIGVNLSRSEIHWYNHNDMADLERVLMEIQKKDRQTKRKVTRRFIVFEGVSFNLGDIAPLPKIVELKNKYKWRLVMEDCGIGSLGKTGRGTCEYHNVDVNEIAILTGNLEYITGSVGGFCCGASNIVFHQRLNSTGYVYSASLPPLLATHSFKALDMIDEQPELLQKFRKNVEFFHSGLGQINGLVIRSNIQSPIIHVCLEKENERFTSDTILQKIVDEALVEGILLTRAKYTQDEKYLPTPSIRICVSSENTQEQLTKALDIIKKATAIALSSIQVPIARSPSSSSNVASSLMKRAVSTGNFN